MIWREQFQISTDFKTIQIDVSFGCICHPGHADTLAKQISPKSSQTEGGGLAELGMQHSRSTSHSAATEVFPEMVTRGDRPVALLTYLELTGEVKEVHESYNQRNTQDQKLMTQKQLCKGGVRNKERGNKDTEVEK